MALVIQAVAADRPPLPRYTLAACLDRALEHNPQIRAAAKRIEEAAGGIVEARAGYLPALTSSGRYQYRDADYATLAGSQPDRRPELWDINVLLTETVYSGGAVPARLAIARLQEDIQWLEHRVTVDRVLMETRIAFHDILRQQANVAARREAVAFYERRVEHQQARLEAGTGEKLHLLRAEVNRALERSALEEAEKQRRLATLRLAELLDLPDGESAFTIRGRLHDIEPVPGRDECLARARANRPELQVRRNQVAIQEHQLRLDRSALRPQVDLFAGYEVVNEPNRNAATDSYDGWIAGVAVRWSIFDGWATRGRMQATAARRDAAMIDETAARQTVDNEVHRAYRELETAQRTIVTQAENVALAAESVELAQKNFAEGVSSQLELIQGQLDLTRAQTALAGAHYDYQAARARLDRATGRRWSLPSSTEHPAP